MAYSQFEKIITDSTVPVTSPAVPLVHAENLAIDTTWAWSATPAPFDVQTGLEATNVVTFPAVAGAADGDFLVIEGLSGTLWLVALDTDGGGITNAGPIFTSVPVANRAVVDVSGVADAADVAALAVAALNLLPGFTDDFTLTDNLDGSVDFVSDIRGVLPPLVSLVADESGAGSITFVETVAGIDSAFFPASDEIAAIAHGLTTGQIVQVAIGAGDLPAPLAAATNYFVIRVNDDEIRLATSYANSIAGTSIDLTDRGTANQLVTFTPGADVGTLDVEYTTDNPPLSTSTWVNLVSTNLATATSPVQTRIPVNYYGFIRAKLALSSGNLSSLTSVAFGKEKS